MSAATVSSLEATLAAIERAEARRTQAQGSIKRTNSTSMAVAAAAAGAAAGGGGSGASSRRTSRSNSIGTSAAASRQLSPREGRTDPQAGAAVPSADPAAAAAECMDSVEDGSAAAAGGAGSGSAAALSKELVKAHTATADAQRKLRVSAR